MWRASPLAVAAVVFVTASGARADDAPRGKKKPPAAEPARAPREVLTQQFGDEAAAIESALGTVTEKLAAADTARTRRLAAAYRILQLPVGEGEDAMATARRRAAARLLIDRDLAERTLLAVEANQLRTAAKRTADDAKRASEIVLPESIGRPVKGTIARRFGTFVHERSKATLSRRGLDFEVAARAEVVAVADGQVRYAGPIRGLETGVVVDHGTYFTVIGKLAESVVPVGTRVVRGDRLGRAQRGRVYFEVRVKLGPGGLPIDPEPLFSR
ncbi:MAG: M23 family metallopeptidase [Deltaproteobacteria bacterium]|nr:M23 family metallopeptidase [Deltaproteobacteria bacterium]